MFARTISSEPQDILSPNLVWLCSMISQSVIQKNWFTMFNVKVTARAYIIKTWLFLLFLQNCWLVCNQTWFDSTASLVGVSCGKMGLLHLRSRSQRRFKMSVNVCLGDMFWITEHLLSNLVSHWNIMSQSAMQKFGRVSSRSKSQQGLIMIKIWVFLL